MAPQPTAPDAATPWLSIVVPLKNEAENVGFVTEAIVAACAALAPYEIVYVDDGSDRRHRRPRPRPRRAPPRGPPRPAPASAGQSAAVHSGVDLRPRQRHLHPRRRRPEPALRDPEARRPPRRRPAGRGFPEGVALVAGQRVGRQDTASKRWASRAANGIRQRLLQRRHPRHRLRAEALPPRRLPRPALLRPHAPLPAGARRPRRLADAAPGRRPRPPPRRPLQLLQPRARARRRLRSRRRRRG